MTINSITGAVYLFFSTQDGHRCLLCFLFFHWFRLNTSSPNGWRQALQVAIFIVEMDWIDMMAPAALSQRALARVERFFVLSCVSELRVAWVGVKNFV